MTGINTSTPIRTSTSALSPLAARPAIARTSPGSASAAISDGMRSQIRGLNQAAQNVQIGQSMLQLADGVLGIAQEMLHRIRELTVQASNGTLSDSQRSIIAMEIDQLTLGIGDIARNTEFNGMRLLSPPSQGGIAGLERVLQVGPNSGQLMRIVFPDIYTNVYEALKNLTDNTDWTDSVSISSIISSLDNMSNFLSGARAQVMGGTSRMSAAVNSADPGIDFVLLIAQMSRDQRAESLAAQMGHSAERAGVLLR